MTNQTELLKPNLVDVKVASHNRTHVTIEPLERGFGHTLGNALRRILLSSMPGAAISEVQIDGVLHEYSSVEGVKEDVVEVLLNLKNIAIAVEGDMTETSLTLHKKGEGAVLAGDISHDSSIRVVNPDLVIAHLEAKGELNMTLKVTTGRGYVSSVSRQVADEVKPVGAIALDASYSL